MGRQRGPPSQPALAVKLECENGITRAPHLPGGSAEMLGVVASFAKFEELYKHCIGFINPPPKALQNYGV